MEDIEEGPVDAEPPEPAESPPADTEDRRDSPSGADVATEDLLARYREFLEDRPPRKPHAKDAVVEALRFLREHERVGTSDLRDHLAAEFGEHYAGEKAMWDSLRRYLQDLPGFDDSQYAAWAYTGDGAVREALEGVDGGNA